MAFHGKKYTANAKLVDRTKFYTVQEAVELAKKTATTKFDGAIDIAIKLNLDTTKAEQQLRGTIALPHYFGKKIRIVAITDTISDAQAKELGIKVGTTDLINEIKGGWLDFDLIITSPKFMVQLSKLGKVLGPKGLMPNPKLGTVTPNVLAAVKEFQKGKYNYRTDTYGNIHMKIGKASAKTEDIVENINALLDFIKSKRPATVKGDYIQNLAISSTMGPSIKIAK